MAGRVRAGDGASGEELPLLDEDGGPGAAPSTEPHDLTSITVDAIRAPRLDAVSQGARAHAEEIRPGAFIGRYVVLERIAVGGMGAVYKAYDPKLDRRVAVKVLLTEDDAAKSAAARLTREAKALAQLSHPNVVAVYDVGAYNDDVFVAMALVEGQTLGAWAKQQPRSSAEVVSVFIAAGHGLAAAHRAGLVHRDFKPDNVLIGNDARVQVVDFGIARAQDVADIGPLSVSGNVPLETTGDASADASAPVDDIVTSPPVPLPGLESLTQEGAVVGTPTYMSPEQFLGAAIDAKSDQFSFCVALYECLYGHRPFAGKNLRALKRNVVSGAMRPPGTVSRAPARLRRIVERGLSVSPSDRYDTMGALLAELSKDPHATLRWVGLAAGAVAVATLTAVVAQQGGSPAPALCKGARGELAGRWDHTVRAAARAAFVATGKPYADAAFGRAAELMDEYADGWVRARTEACEATHVHGTQSGNMLDLRMRCLNRRRDALASLASVFAGRVDAATVEEALPAAMALPPLIGCADDAALEQAVPPPDDPEERARVESLGRQLSQARALDDAGRYADGLAVIGEVTEAVDATGYAPLRAELRYLEGRLQLAARDGAGAEAAFRAALVHAAEAHNDELIADAWVLLMRALDDQAQVDAGLGLEATAAVAVLRAGDHPLQRGQLHESTGRLHYSKGAYEAAIGHQEQALALVESALGTDHPEVAQVLASVAPTHFRRGNHAEARVLFEKSLAIRERVFGTEHPIVARSVYQVAVVAGEERDYERSEALYLRALELFRRAHGDEHDTALVLSGLGYLYDKIGRHADSERALRESLAIRETLLGPDDIYTGTSLAMLGTLLSHMEDYAAAELTLLRARTIWEAKLGLDHSKLSYLFEELGTLHSKQGRFETAEPFLRRALEIRRATFGDEHREVAVSHAYYGDALAEAGRAADALTRYERALEIYRTAVGAEDPALIPALSGLGECYLALGRPAPARQVLERAVAIRSKYQLGDPYPSAQTDYALGRALWSDPSQRSRARELATHARSVFAADARPSAAARRDQVDRWLRGHPEQSASAPL